MLLSDTAILQAISEGDIAFDPPISTKDLRPAGVRLHLGPHILIPRTPRDNAPPISFSNPQDNLYTPASLEEAPHILLPGTFCLAEATSCIKTSNRLACFLDGRSTVARLGLFIHHSAFMLDGTHLGYLKPVLELFNTGPFRILLEHRIPIGMACFLRTTSPMSAARSSYSPQLHLGPPLFSPSPPPFSDID